MIGVPVDINSPSTRQLKTLAESVEFSLSSDLPVVLHAQQVFTKAQGRQCFAYFRGERIVTNLGSVQEKMILGLGRPQSPDDLLSTLQLMMDRATSVYHLLKLRCTYIIQEVTYMDLHIVKESRKKIALMSESSTTNRKAALIATLGTNKCVWGVHSNHPSIAVAIPSISTFLGFQDFLGHASHNLGMRTPSPTDWTNFYVLSNKLSFRASLVSILPIS
ncbi:hypothetical protein A2801_01510 [Candidatus Woesebacteria bacterium RIFCSPHIGHO2_01_FULL_41_10]|uniref:Uncharacterized protein n=1 Tax=Candidatus Woesebacteria bacterium RIFCSPHIGHO2_01_FULL_41_10 TaxID=1802500 RepID=A0A1F7YPT4_9BACT|nr:MAG: hypothetical protein A2801_01510 [Candidatus Woesebacteria bacterium RIFCSPHIGHO2_01_FULL_41_10]